MVTSVKLTTGTNILELFQYMTSIPSGVLLMSDLEATFGRVDRENFNDNGRFRLIYFTREEYDDLQQGILPRVR